MICFNRAGQVLLVSSLGNDKCWVFPKGHIDDDENTNETAAREVAEEAGIEALEDSASPIGQTSYVYKGETVIVDWWTGLASHPTDDSEAHWGFRNVLWVD